MGVSVCPAAVVAASCERVWSVVTQPEHYGDWTDANVVRIVPPGPPVPGQVVHGTTRGFGRSWGVSITIEAIDEPRRQLRLITRLPLGIVVHNHITCAPLGSGETCRVQFG